MNAGLSPEELKDQIEFFLLEQAHPVLSEPGHDVVDLSTSSYSLTTQHGRLLWHIWNESTNLVRQITDIQAARSGRLELRYQRFGKGPPGRLVVANTRALPEQMDRRSLRTQYLPRLRRWLHQLFPLWKLQQLTTEPDLARSLSGRYARGWIASGNRAWAVIGSGEEPGSRSTDDILAYGLLWLDRLRERHPSHVLEGLKIFLPRGAQELTRSRLAWLNPRAAKCELYETSHGIGEQVQRCELDNFGNLKTSLQRFSQPDTLEPEQQRLAASISLSSPQVESCAGSDGRRRWSLRGLVFARQQAGRIVFGLGRSETLLTDETLPALRRLVRKIEAFRNADAGDRNHPLYRLQPERWMQSVLSRRLDCLGEGLNPALLYEQVPAVSGTARGLLDLLAVDATGRLVVIELKASEDLQLPLQALDYWMRVHWHHQRGDLAKEHYFPNCHLSRQPPLLLLVSPALQFHSGCEIILRYLSPEMEVVRIGLNEGWRKDLQVILRQAGPRGPEKALLGRPELPAGDRSEAGSP